MEAQDGKIITVHLRPDPQFFENFSFPSCVPSNFVSSFSSFTMLSTFCQKCNYQRDSRKDAGSSLSLLHRDWKISFHCDDPINVSNFSCLNSKQCSLQYFKTQEDLVPIALPTNKRPASDRLKISQCYTRAHL